MAGMSTRQRRSHNLAHAQLWYWVVRWLRSNKPEGVKCRKELCPALIAMHLGCVLAIVCALAKLV